MSTLDLDLCQALKRAGFPQDQWPQAIYECDEEGSPWTGKSAIHESYPHTKYHVYIAAPEALDVLDWMEREKAWKWAKYGNHGGPKWYAWTPPTEQVWADTAPELIRAILVKMEAA